MALVTVCYLWLMGTHSLIHLVHVACMKKFTNLLRGPDEYAHSLILLIQMVQLNTSIVGVTSHLTNKTEMRYFEEEKGCSQQVLKTGFDQVNVHISLSSNLHHMRCPIHMVQYLEQNTGLHFREVKQFYLLISQCVCMGVCVCGRSQR